MDEPTNIDNPDIQKILAQQEVTITPEDKENFYKSFLADTPYIEDAKLFGDRLTVTFKTLNMDENSQIFKQIKLDQKNGQADIDDEYMIRISMYRLALSLLKVNGDAFHPEIDDKKIMLSEDKELSLVKARADLFKAWPTFKLHSVLDAFRFFEKKVLRLSTEVMDPNFWTAAK